MPLGLFENNRICKNSKTVGILSDYKKKRGRLSADGRLGLDGMRLAAAAFDGCRGLVAGDEMTREVETALCEHGRTVD